MTVARALRASVLVALLLLVVPAAASAGGLGLGFSDIAFTGPDGAALLQRAAGAGANAVRIDIGWPVPDTATKPGGFNARNPADPHYDFGAADAAIKEAHALGLRVLVTFTGAPPWAEGPRRPAGVAPGTWRPSPRALEDYAIALGKRYSGTFPDPTDPGHTLPRVDAFQVWNEPNLNLYLSPQWSGDTPASPSMYRAMLNAFYRGLKSVDPGALVVTAATAPFGDPQPGGNRLQPARFWRGVLCLVTSSTGALDTTRCSNPAHFDVLAHNMYSWGSPQTHAFWPDDVAIPDLGKLTTVLRAAERTGGALPRGRHPIWITELGYNTDPPNPYGVPVATDARWLDEALAELWREGASSIFWYLVRDEPPIPNYSQTSQSGVYFVNGEPKQPVLKAFQFPIDVWRARGTTVDVWIRSPLGGRLEIQRHGRSGWGTVGVRQVRAGASFLTVVADGGGRGIRARIGGDTSVAWRVG